MKPSNATGFTLVEIVIAIFLVVVGFMGLISMSGMVINGNGYSRMSTTASSLATDKMEDLKAVAFKDGDLSEGVHVDGGNPIHGIYTRSWSVTNYMNAAGTKVAYKTIDMTVMWNWRGQTRSVSLTTLQSNSS